MARHGQDDARADADEIERYRRAAEETLGQLDWCVDYLYRVGRYRIARVIAQNRSRIRRAMDGTA